ncbi:MAG: NUDIX domain-containing protein [Erythrobacter sp.]|nr:NUDIX domain-containing protein [Erythrobacter sp.]
MHYSSIMALSPTPQADPIPAATLVIFREGRSAPEPEILMVVRSKELRFAGGMAVFPGGRVDPEDRDLAARHAPDASEVEQDELAHRIAAIRETLEETGLALGISGAIDADSAAAARRLALEQGALAPVLDRFGWTLEPGTLTAFARWLPVGLAHNRIFDTRFYIADLGTGAVDVAVDETENTSLFWTSATEALAMADRGEIKLIFPTRRNLERLARFANYAEARAHAEAIPVRTIIPEIDESGPRPVLRIPDDAGYPITQEVLESAMRG